MNRFYAVILMMMIGGAVNLKAQTNPLTGDAKQDYTSIKSTLVQIRIWFYEVKKAEHLLACGWALEKPIATRRRLSLDSSQQYLLTNSAVDSSFGI
jgi:hypothetical protein